MSGVYNGELVAGFYFLEKEQGKESIIRNKERKDKEGEKSRRKSWGKEVCESYIHIPYMYVSI